MKYVYVYNGEYCLALKGKEMLPCARAGMRLEKSMLSEAPPRKANSTQFHLQEIINYWVS